MARLGRSYPIARVLHSATKAGNTNISDGDTGTGTDTESISASFTDTDIGTGVDTESIAATLTDADTSAGTETATIDVSDTDTAVAVDSESSSSSSSDAETGAGSETATVGVSDADTGSGTDTEATTQGATDAETNSGTDTESIAATNSDTDTGAGTETWSLIVTLSDSDTVAGLDTESAGGGTTPSDTEGGGASETQSIQVFVDGLDDQSLVMGPASLYIAPFGALEPVNSAIGSAPDPLVWTDLGGTLSGVDLTVEQDWTEIELKQLTDTAMRRLKKRRLSIKTQLAEPTLANLAYALNDSAPVSGVFEPTARSEASVLSYNALIVDGWCPGFKPGGQHKRRRVIIRKTLSIDNVELQYSKEGQSVYTVTWSCHYVSAAVSPFRVIDEA